MPLWFVLLGVLRLGRRGRAGQFQRPGAQVELSRADARARGIANGDTVTVRSNGTSVALRAKVSKRLREGLALVPADHAEGLHSGPVEVSK